MTFPLAAPGRDACDIRAIPLRPGRTGLALPRSRAEAISQLLVGTCTELLFSHGHVISIIAPRDKRAGRLASPGTAVGLSELRRRQHLLPQGIPGTPGEACAATAKRAKGIAGFPATVRDAMNERPPQPSSELRGASLIASARPGDGAAPRPDHPLNEGWAS